MSNHIWSFTQPTPSQKLLCNREPRYDNNVTGKNERKKGEQFYPRLENYEPDTNTIRIQGKIEKIVTVFYVGK